MKYWIYSLLFLGMILGCKNQKYQLEGSNDISLKEGYFKEISSGTFEGESSIEVTLIFNKFNSDKITLKGFYFRNKYIEHSPVKSAFAMRGAVVKSTDIKKTIPFSLENFETVVSYSKEGKQLYAKFPLKLKETKLNEVPMEMKN